MDNKFKEKVIQNWLLKTPLTASKYDAIWKDIVTKVADNRHITLADGYEKVFFSQTLATAIREIYLGRQFVAIAKGCNNDDVVLVEYTSTTKPNKQYAVAYNPSEGVFEVAVTADREGQWGDIRLSDPESQIPFLMAMVVGLAVHRNEFKSIQEQYDIGKNPIMEVQPMQRQVDYLSGFAFLYLFGEEYRGVTGEESKTMITASFISLMSAVYRTIGFGSLQEAELRQKCGPEFGYAEDFVSVDLKTGKINRYWSKLDQGENTPDDPKNLGRMYATSKKTISETFAQSQWFDNIEEHGATAMYFVNPIDTFKATVSAKQKEYLQYRLPIHTLTPTEQMMVPTLSPGYVVDDNLLLGAQMVVDDWRDERADLAMNIILEGDSGSGKTAATKFWAHIFGMPRTKITMSPTMESANLIGAFYPVFQEPDEMFLTQRQKEGLALVQKQMSKMACMNETATKNVTANIHSAIELIEEPLRKALQIPSVDEIARNPRQAWGALGGNVANVPFEDEITLEANAQLENATYAITTAILEEHSCGQMQYRFVLSELMKAFQHGWLVEIQEAASVLRPGVLTELNSLLEPNGRLELPNGEFIHRHPDTIVVFTTNAGYAGNAPLNESLRDRCVFALKMDSPPVDIMASRLSSVVGMTDDSLSYRAAEVVADICATAKTTNIRGSFGMRSLLAWGKSLKRGDFSKETFLARVVHKMTTNDEDEDILMDVFRKSSFCSTYCGK